MKKYIQEIFFRIYWLVIKLIARKSLFQIYSKYVTLILLKFAMDIQNINLIIILYLASTISDFVYFRFLQFDKVKTNISLGNK